VLVLVLRERSLVGAISDYLSSANPDSVPTWQTGVSLSLTCSKQVDRVDPRRLVVLLIALDEDM
jgi:hypothetical protein